MSSDKKYYWLKLKEDFFDEKQIKYLSKLPEGDKLVITYLKMQLKSLRTDGFIKYDKILPSNEEELAMILDEEINIVKLTLGALVQSKAIEILDDGSFYMIAMQELIGKEGESAERVRKFRERHKQKLLQSNASVTECNTEIEIEEEKEQELYSPKKPKKNVEKKTEKYGQYQNVFFTEEQYQKLKNEFPNDYEKRIENLDDYMQSHGAKYKDCLATIRAWAKKEKNKNTQTNKNLKHKNYEQRNYDNLDEFYDNL